VRTDHALRRHRLTRHHVHAAALGLLLATIIQVVAALLSLPSYLQWWGWL
jgi:hypothetical protein